MISKTERHITYPIALLLSIPYKKTFEAIGEEIGMSGDSVPRILEDNVATPEALIEIAKKIFGKKRLYLIIDDTVINKMHSKMIEGTCDNYDSTNKTTYRSFCSVVAVLTDGKIAIPIDQEFWLSEEFAKNEYLKKWQVAQILVQKIYSLLPVYMFLADGLYAVVDFMKWLISNQIKFEMRIHSNRVIEIEGAENQVREHPKLRPNGWRPIRTQCGTWQGMFLHFTALFRILANGHIVITYQVSNYTASAREHVKNYSYRWNIEKFFRTAKQKLGLSDCQSRKINLQKKHIFSVFYAYALLQIERKKKRLPNVETFLKSIKYDSFLDVLSYFIRSTQIFGIA